MTSLKHALCIFVLLLHFGGAIVYAQTATEPDQATATSAPANAPNQATVSGQEPPSKTQEQAAPTEDKPAQAQAKPSYKLYAYSDCEFAIALPELPTVETIRNHVTRFNFMVDQPEFGIQGERAFFKRSNPVNSNYIDVEVTCVRANPQTIQSMNRAKVQEELRDVLSRYNIERARFNFSPGAASTSWGIYKGFSLDDQDQDKLLSHTAHILTGQTSIFIVRITYSFEDLLFQKMAREIDRSIVMVGQ